MTNQTNGPSSWQEAVNMAKAGQVHNTSTWNSAARDTFRANGGKG